MNPDNETYTAKLKYPNYEPKISEVVRPKLKKPAEDEDKTKKPRLSMTKQIENLRLAKKDLMEENTKLRSQITKLDLAITNNTLSDSEVKDLIESHERKVLNNNNLRYKIGVLEDRLEDMELNRNELWSSWWYRMQVSLGWLHDI